MQRVCDLTEAPEVGRAYLVTCVKMQGSDEWIPVLGPPHADPDLAEPQEHWNRDMRFIADYEILEKYLALKGPLNFSPIEFVMRAGPAVSAIEEVAEREMICRRQAPIFPMFPVGDFAYSYAVELERRFENHKLDLDCLECPHRKVSLKGQQVINNVIVCPGHGLAWNAQTGEIAKRYPEKYCD